MRFESEGTYTFPLAISGAETLVKSCGLSTEVKVLFHSSLPRLLASSARRTPATELWFASLVSGIDTHKMPFDDPFADRDIIPPGIPVGGGKLLVDTGGVLNVEPL